MSQSKFLKKSKTVQERWFRMKFHRKFGIKLKNLMLKKLHRKLNKEFLNTDKHINQAIETTVFEYRKIDDSKFPATKEFYNVALYFLLAERDIQALKADAFANPNKTKRNIALRALLLTIYEWDMGKVTGRKMGGIYEATGLSDETKQEVVNALKLLRKSHKKIENKFSKTRHNAIAHRGADAMGQFEMISGLEIMQFSLVLTNFYVASNKLLKAMLKAIVEMGSTQNLFHQIGYTEKGLKK